MLYPNIEKKYNIFFVTTSQDSIPGSLRYAINQANLSSNLSPNLLSKIIIKPLHISQIVLTNGEIVISSNIKLINATNNDLTIKATDNNRLFHIISPSFYFKIGSLCHKLILSNGSINANGGAIYVEPSNHNLILKNVIITNNTAKRAGGGIHTQGNVTLFSSIVISNMANTQGGGIWSGHSTIMHESTVTKNLVLVAIESNGGGGIFVDNGNCVLDKSHVTHNLVTYDLIGRKGGSGGGIVVMNGTVFVQNNSHVDYNTAYNSGGIQEGIGDVNIANKSSVSFNKSFNSDIAAGGGGITITMGTVNISDSKIHANKTKGMFSGGIVSLVGDVVVTNHSEISENTNQGPGGGIAVNIGSVVIDNSNISNNKGASLGGAIVCFASGPVSVSKSITNNNILTNAQTIRQTIEAFFEVISGYLLSTSIQATESGGEGSKAYIQQIPIILAKTKEINDQLKALPSSITNNNTIAGGAIACLLSISVTIDDSFIKCNFVGKYVDQTNAPFDALAGGVFGFLAKIKINSSIIEKNISVSDAGGILSKTELLLSHSKVIENKSTYGNGGGILNDVDGKALIIDSIISGNLARQNGGGINNRGRLELINTKITLNGAKNTGGGIISIDPFIKINSKIIDNYPNNVVIL
jgi:predicted outer membrane repeat protein